MKNICMKIAMVLVLFQLSSCHYYKAGLVKTITPEYIVQKNAIRDYVIIHFKEEIWHMSGIKASGNIVLGDKRELVAPHTSVLKDQYRTNTIKRYKRRDFVPTNEVHIYVNALEDDGTKISLDINDIDRIEVYDEAMGATIATYVGTAFVMTAVAGTIFLAIACGCPAVYTYDGVEYTFQGNVFSGAIGKSLERGDYLPLIHPEEVDGSFQLKLANEKPETEFIDFAELLTVQHPENTQVLYSRQGKLISYSDPKIPSLAEINSLNKLELISAKDEKNESFTDNSDVNGMNSLILSFEKPLGTESSKLLLTAKNSKWMDYIFIDFFHQFGDYYSKFKKQQQSATTSDRVKWLKEQGVLLNVYIETDEGWKYYDYFNVVGSASKRDIGMHLSGLDPEKTSVKIKLESGFGFWELDYAAMDFSNDSDIMETFGAVKKAHHSNGEEVTKMLSEIDASYVSDMERGDELFLEFDIPSQQPGFTRTHFLHSSGYYEMDLNIEGKAKLSYLRKFRKKGRFSKLSKDLFHEMNSPLMVSKPN